MTTHATQQAHPDHGPDHAARLYRAYVFDLDGTIYLGDELLPGVARTISALRDRGCTVRFLSNNPTRDIGRYVEKLGRLDLTVDSDDIVGTVVATTSWLLAHHPDAVVFPISEQPLKDALARAGIATSCDPAAIDIVLASYDRAFDYAKLQIAFDAIWLHGRAFLVGTNPDRYCPMPGGRGEPDAAAVIAAIEACTGVTARKILGKPDPTILDTAIGGLGIDRDDCIVVGDRVATDIALAHNAGVASALVLTGETGADDVADLPPRQRPTYVLDRIDRLVPAPLWTDLGWDAASSVRTQDTPAPRGSYQAGDAGRRDR